MDDIAQNDTTTFGSRLAGAAAARAGKLVAVAFRRWRSIPANHLEAFRKYRSPLASITRTPMPDFGARVERWTLVDERGDTFTALWRAGLDNHEARPGQKPWTVVMLGGFYAGDKAALLLPENVHTHALAVDWPWKGERRMTRKQFVKNFPAIYEAGMRAPSTLALGVDALVRQPEVDASRIALVGASLGVPPTLAALHFTSAPTAAVLVHGAADNNQWLTHEMLRRRWRKELVTAVTSMGRDLIGAHEPALHREAAAHLRMLIVNAREDQFVPPYAAEALHRLFPQAEVRWQEGQHVAGNKPTDVLTALAFEIEDWLYR